jgi:hypothetical protein
VARPADADRLGLVLPIGLTGDYYVVRQGGSNGEPTRYVRQTNIGFSVLSFQTNAWANSLLL